jgi:hypothetical protein
MHENARTRLFDKLEEDYKREYAAFKANFNSFLFSRVGVTPMVIRSKPANTDYFVKSAANQL